MVASRYVRAACECRSRYEKLLSLLACLPVCLPANREWEEDHKVVISCLRVCKCKICVSHVRMPLDVYAGSILNSS